MPLLHCLCFDHWQNGKSSGRVAFIDKRLTDIIAGKRDPPYSQAISINMKLLQMCELFSV